MVLREYFTKPVSKTLTPSMRTSLIAALVALSVSSNYALIWIPNVKLMDLLVFVAGFISGPFDGAIVGALSWIVYGFLNPRGWILTILVATTVAEAVYGIAGGFLRKIHIMQGKLSWLCWACSAPYFMISLPTSPLH